MNFPGVLELERRRQGLTSTELARRMGVPRPQVSEVERGHRRPNPSFRAKAATALGVSEQDLFPRYWFLVLSSEGSCELHTHPSGSVFVFETEGDAERRAC